MSDIDEIRGVINLAVGIAIEPIIRDMTIMKESAEKAARQAKEDADRASRNAKEDAERAARVAKEDAERARLAAALDKEQMMREMRDAAEHQAATVVETALDRFLETLGLPANDPKEKGEFIMDLRWVRNLRTGSAKGIAQVVGVLITVITTGAAAWFWAKTSK